jgi:prevent-host-death family protein
MTSRTIGAAEARNELPALLDRAEEGEMTVIIRRSKPAAAVIPAGDLEAYEVFRGVLHEFGEMLEVSTDPATISAVREAEEALTRGEVTWHHHVVLEATSGRAK